MAPKGTPVEGQQTLSSFFKPAQPLKKRPTAVVDGVLLLSDSDDDNDEHGTREGEGGTRPPKRVKKEHSATDSQLQAIASTSTLPTSPGATTAPPSAATRRLAAFAYSHKGTTPARTRSTQDQKRHDEFVERLSLGPNLLKKRRTNYLQKDHYLAAQDDDQDDNGGSSGAAYDEDEDGVSSEDESGTSIRAKGKGKGKATDDDSGTSPFARFAAKGSSAAAKKDAPTAKVKYTPLEQQVLALRKANPGVLLVIEVGYKFRFFGEDAQAASRVLNIACFPSQHMLTASIPTHRIDFHVKRLLNAGYKVGVIRQQETAALKKASDNRSAPFTRALSALYTSATYVDELEAAPLPGQGGETATLMCIVEDTPKGGKQGVGAGADAKVRIAVVAVVPSTWTVVYDEFEDTLMRAELETRMLHLQPSELLLQKDLSNKTESMVKYLARQYSAGKDDFTARVDRIAKRPTAAQATSTISDFYAKKDKGAAGRGKGKSKEVERGPSEIVLSSDEEDDLDPRAPSITPGPDGQPAAILDLPKLVLVALASLITHLEPFGLSRVFKHASSFAPFASRAAMTLNGNTVANLELLRNSTDFSEAGSLVSVLDRCKTAMGKRLLRRWVTKPLLSLELITERHDALTAIQSSHTSLTFSKLRDLLRAVPDLERGLSRIHLGRATPQELLRVLEAFVRTGSVFEEVETAEGDEEEEGGGALRSAMLKRVVEDLPRVRGTAERLLAELAVKAAHDGDKERLFADEGKYPALQACKEGLQRTMEGMNDELKAARKLLRKPALQFTKVSQEEYLFEVKIAEAKAVPADWVRINATKQVHRYRSPTLQKKLDKLEQWKEKVAAAAQDAFLFFLQEVASHYELFRQTIVSLATADCLFSLALVAHSNNWARPALVPEAGRIELKGARHPIIEAISHEVFVPNDVEFGEGKRRHMLLTGLNMGGKSSLSRSIALIALLAQVGSFVPAESATLSLFDGIFTRMGASDDLARGRSTFMVELSETSAILRAATPRSLLILDELGRGTSTHDGLAIAHAVLEHLVRAVRCTTVFVSHYPALGALARRFPREVTAEHMACREDAGTEGGPPQITFLYRLVPGLASASHGLNVARLAELPESVVQRAAEKGAEMERVEEGRAGKRRERRLAEVLRRVAGAVRGEAGEEGRRETVELCEVALAR